MGTHARIDYGYISIETAAWLNHRTAGTLDELTADLHGWAAHPDHRPTETHLVDMADRGVCAWQDAVLRWCTERHYTSPDPADPHAGATVICHIGTRLDADLWLARTRTPRFGPIVVVQLNTSPPVVYSDDVTDTADWYDADTVDIACPAGHGWTWRTGRELIDARGRFTTVTAVFGPDLDAPFTSCPACTAHRDGRRRTPCGCDGSSWICCPTCGARCDVHLPTR